MIRQFLAIVLLAVYPTFTEAQVLEDDVCAKHKIAYHRALKHSQTAAAPSLPLDVLKADISWKIDPAERYIAGRVEYHFQMTDSLDAIRLDLATELSVDSVKSGTEVLAYEQTDPHHLKIELARQLAAGAKDSLTLYYQGVPPSGQGFGSFEVAEADSQPVMWTLSEPYGAKDWWPCFQNLTEKIDHLEISVEVPHGFKVGTNGVLQGSEDLDSTTIYHYQHDFPIVTYLVAVAVAKYEQRIDTVQLTTGMLPIHNLLYAETVEPARQALDFFPEFLVWMDSLMTPYPFMGEKYGHAQFGWGGGMEHQTMSFMGQFTFELMIHELAHQWFGNFITCGSWQDIWLNEGFATYFTGLAYEYFSTTNNWEVFRSQLIKNVTSKPGGSVYVEDTSSVSRIFNSRLSYRKGAMVLHMLRWELGDEAFFQALRNYLSDTSLAYGFARTKDLQNHLENESGRNLDEFMADWLYGEGYPSYTIQWQQADGQLEIKATQTQSHAAVDFFEMHLPIHVTTAMGDTTLRLHHTRNGQQWQVALPGNLQKLAFDPEMWLLSADNKVIRFSPQVVVIGISQEALPSHLVVSSLNPFLEIDRFEIYDVAGRKMVSFENPDRQRFSIPVSGWARGQYIIRMTSGNREATEVISLLR